MAQPADIGQWNKLFVEAMKHQAGPRDRNQPLESMSEERKQWLDAALTDMTKDLVQRMKEIKERLDLEPQAAAAQADDGGTTPSTSEREALLDELTEIVEQIDCAKDWSKLGGLATLLAQLRSVAPGVRMRAAEAIAAAAQNNPFVQRAFMEGGAMAALLQLLGDCEARVATKALLALSAMVRHFDAGMEAFRLAGGLLRLVDMLPQQAPAAADSAGPEALKQQRKALQLLAYVCARHPADCDAAVGFGAAERLAALAERSPDEGIRAAAMGVLSELAQQPGAWQQLQERTPGLLAYADALVARHAALRPEEREVAQEEVDAAVQLAALLRQPPVGAKAPLLDHVDLDPYQDAAGAARQPLPLALGRHQLEGGLLGERAKSQAPAGGLALMRAPLH